MEEARQRRIDEIDQFYYLISHDLKAPLRGIANLSRWIEEDSDGEINAVVREHLDLLRGRVLRMETMIDGILQYSRIERDRVRPERVDVAALLAEVIASLESPPRSAIEVASEMPNLITERLCLEQVFLNLIGNALKYHHAPAQNHVRVSTRDQGDFSEFTVADDGPGIAPAYHDRVFVIFQTLQARDTVEGTGLGLSMVKKIVQMQGGTITLESDLGQGSRFRFTWPKAPRWEALAEDSRENRKPTDAAENAKYRARGR